MDWAGRAISGSAHVNKDRMFLRLALADAGDELDLRALVLPCDDTAAARRKVVGFLRSRGLAETGRQIGLELARLFAGPGRGKAGHPAIEQLAVLVDAAELRAGQFHPRVPFLRAAVIRLDLQ